MKYRHVLIAMLGAMALSGCVNPVNQPSTLVMPASSTVDATPMLASTAVPSLTAEATIASHQGTLSPRSTRPAGSANPTSSVVLDVPFEITIGQTVEIASEGLAITFQEVTEDSRCPVDVECFWAGQAIIEVEIARQGSSLGSVSLTLGQDEAAAQASLSGYQITFIGLDPIPDTRNPSPPEYAATLSVARGGK